MKIKLIPILAMTTVISLSGCSALSDSSTHASSMANMVTATHNLDNIGIKNQADQQVWSNFVQNCIVKDNISADKLISLASSGTSGISDFLASFKAPTEMMTKVYGSMTSCPHALPVVQKIVSSISS
jgi:hypothetical protein